MIAQQKVMGAIAMVIIIAIFPCDGLAENEITWMEAEFPPGYIHDGPFAGQGYEDVITAILQNNLPEYTHHRIICNLARMTHEFQQGKQVCNVALYKTPEREKFMEFSIPSTFSFPNRLIVLKKNLQNFGNSSQVSLEDIMKKKLKIGISRDRSYSVTIDAILNKYKPAEHIVVHSGKDVFETLLKMLIMNRIDCMLGLPEEVIYVAEQLGVKDQIATLGITETEEKYETWLGYVACSKTDWGKQLIQKINRILLEHRKTPQYRGAYERWLDSNSIETYRSLYDTVFLKYNE